MGDNSKRRYGSVDALPVEVIGIILSHVKNASWVASASATCRKWRNAAKHHLRNLTIERFDLCGKDNASSRWETMITEILMKTSCLEELKICVEPAHEYEFEAAPVIAWLMHTRETLRSLTFLQPVRPTVNILEKFGCGLKKLWWGSGCITAVNPTIRYESLVFLTLFCMRSELGASELQSIVSSSPKLENLVLVSTYIVPHDGGTEPQLTMELKSSSLKNLYISRGLDSVQGLMLHADRLDSLYLKGVELQQVKLVQGHGNGTLRILSVDSSSIEDLDARVSASLLSELHITQLASMDRLWAKYYSTFAGASKLRKLYLSGRVPDLYKFNIGLDKISLSFPCLWELGLNYMHAHDAFNVMGGFPSFPSVRVLQVCTPKFNKGFTMWVADLLKCCPKLKRFHISGRSGGTDSEIDRLRMAKFTSRMIHVMRPYPEVDIKFYFLKPFFE